MKVTLFGTGYVGLVTGACLAEMGNHVVCVDVDAAKVARLKRGEIPIYEPALEPIVRRNHASGQLDFTTEAAPAIAHAEVIFIAVGTPPDEDGSADLQYVLAVARSIGRHLNRYAVVVNKSTVPVGTADQVRAAIAAALAERAARVEFDVVSNPEFLKEGSALEDVLRPDRVVIGVDNPRVAELMKELYAPFTRNGHPVILMDIPSAELTKYAANAFLATKISFINKISELCDRTGADIMNIRQGIGSDPRIGMSFLYAGVGYGGSCFPKDVKALIHTGEALDIPMGLLREVESINDRQKEIPGALLRKLFPDRPDLHVAIWGGAFKAETDDIREASSLVLISELLARGARISLYDPEAMPNLKERFGTRIRFGKDPYDVLGEADVLCLLTEWRIFRTPDWERARKLMKSPVIVDGRNQYDPAEMKSKGFLCYGVGRGAASPAFT